ncbi:MAG TPA: thymidine phosphorylase [Terriglobales bacterium]|nr:thymidine phosphorylase [Terriglobales bacterium]
MRATEVIRRKRDGLELSREEISFIVLGASKEEIPDYQLAAWLMAVVLRGMTRAELEALTDAMLHSGQVLDFSDLPGHKVGKHSTGGVGDKTSLVIAPLAAAGGLVVPMISGRGLGHTGGTLDKLESIPGFNVNLTLEQFRRQLRQCGCALIGQTTEIAPADRKMYALRDVTSTVESPYLISASIMSKKLAEGIDSLVLDVKTGSGAFMKEEEDAMFLAKLMVETGQQMGKQVVALITDMDQPLGYNVGNALEVRECVEVLRGEGPADLRELCLELSAWMFHLGGLADSVAAGRTTAEKVLGSGQALERFREIIRLQGGDADVLDDLNRLPQASHQLVVRAASGGYVGHIACEQVGIASMLLGGGREKKEDPVDPAVGVVLHKKVCDKVATGEPLCTLHYNSEWRLEEARQMMEQSYSIVPGPPASPAGLVHRVIRTTSG